MKNLIFSFLFFFCFVSSIGQENFLSDKDYFEDQIYISILYNALVNKPSTINIQQKGLSTGIQLGFIKDIPLNKKGTIAVGIGLGYAYNKFQQNIKINSKLPEFSLYPENYEKNKFEFHSIEIPFELRYRNSTPTVYKFFRIYLGAKVAYSFANKSIFINSNLIDEKSETILLSPLPFLNKFQYGPQISIGWGTWNFYTYYNLNNIFENAPVSEEGIDVNGMKYFKFGLQFYIF